MRTELIALALILTGCADTRPRGTMGQNKPLPRVARIVCEADGTTSVLTPQVEAQRDGVHLVVNSRLDEPASLIGGLAGLDVDPGVS
jgi:hypothetical protein